VPFSLSRRPPTRRPRLALLAAVAVLGTLVAPAAGVAAASDSGAGRLSGLVQDITGRSFAGADVTLAEPGSGAVVASGRSNGDGRYDLAVLNGRYDLTVVSAAADGSRRGRIKDVDVSGDTRLNVVIVGAPKPSAHFSGTVRDGAGRPVPSATVSAGGTTVTDPDGRFDLETPAGDRTLTVVRPLPEGSRITVEAAGFKLSGDRELDVAIRTVGLTVHVRDMQGRPVAGVKVDAWSDENCESCTGAFQIAGLKTSRRSSVRRTTDADGIAYLQALPAKSVRVSVEPPYLSGWSYVVKDGVVLNGDAELTMTVGWDTASAGSRFAAAAAPSGSVTLTGTVGTADARGFGDEARVHLMAGDTEKARSWVGDGGSYSLTAPPGRYDLVVDGPPDEPDGWEPGDIVAQDSYHVTVPNFDLSADRRQDITVPARVVSLRVLDPSGVPVPNAWVDASGAVDENHLFEAAPGLPGYGSAESHWFTGADGIARIRMLPGAPAAVSIDPPGGRGLSGSITVPAGTTGTYDTRLAWGPTLRGHMWTTDGQPVVFGGTFGGEALAFEPDGSYAVTVEPGRYAFSLGGPDVFYRPSESVRWDSLTTDEIEVTADRTLDLTLPTTSGRTVVAAVDVAGRPSGEWGDFDGSSFEPITVAPGIQASTSFGVWEPGPWEVSTDLPILSPTAINAQLGFPYDVYSEDSYAIHGARVYPGEPTIFAEALGSRLPTPDAPQAQGGPGASPGEMSVQWTPPASESEINAYLIVPDDDRYAATWVPGSATSGDLRCLTPGNAYRVTVYALSRYGLSDGVPFEATAANGTVADPAACAVRIVGGEVSDPDTPDSPDGPGGAAGPGDSGAAGGPAAGTSGATKASTTSGYWLLADDGAVAPFGTAANLPGAAPLPAGVKAVDLEPTPARDGYWILTTDGTVHPAGAAPALGSVDRARLAAGERATSLSATPTGHGYWVFTDRGRAVPFGDAVSFGDMSGTKLNGPVLDSIATPTGKGYYLVASDGGIFAFGDAAFAGSMGGRRLNAPVRSLVPDPDGSGYWLVASDGGVFAFDAGFRGSMGGTRLNRPVTGMVPYGDGYLMVAEDGGVFTFSDLPFAGSLGGRPPTRPIVSVASAAAR